jgi:demethylspheroidene O-methyltransferase
LASPRFQRWAARFPLSRPVARRRARALFDLCAGFVYSQVLSACVRLRLFEILAEGPQSPPQLAHRLGLTMEATQRLLAAAAALELVARRGSGRFGLGALGAALLGNPGIDAMIKHHALLYDDVRDPVALLTGHLPETRLGRYWAYARTPTPADLTGDEVAPYTALMSSSQAMIAALVLDAYPFHAHRRLLDIGGGDGTFIAAAAARVAHLTLDLFDLPAVAALAQARFEQAGLRDRARAFGGDFRSQELPRGADVATLLRVIHDHDDATALTILRAAHRALPPDGTLVVAEPMAEAGRSEPAGDAYFGFYLLAMGRGRPRTRQEIERLLRAAGFRQVRPAASHIPMLCGVLVARR